MGALGAGEPAFEFEFFEVVLVHGAGHGGDLGWLGVVR